jgi:16S rRNA (cytidine1402-2'-O)-methyltransferase
LTGNPQEGRTFGRLYVVATPVGNLEDITLRALRILGEVAAIACEDTRQTLKILNRFGLKKPLISYYQPREGRRIPELIGHLKHGRDIALVSDAGTPGISDPGFPLIREALKEGILVVPIPGASAVTAALSASGLPTHRFLFAGFPPPKKTGLVKFLKALKEEDATLVFFLPTRRIPDFLEAVPGALGNRRIVIARELTKIHEEFLRGSVGELSKSVGKRTLKGEATILVEGC